MTELPDVASRPLVTESPQRPVRAPRYRVGLQAAVLAAVFAFWAYLDRGLWFFGDEWDFLTRRGLHGAYFSIWAPHNEHWSVLPIILWRSIFALWHLSSYWPYLVPVLIAHLGVVHLLWRRCRREGVPPVIGGGFSLLMGFFGTGAENLAWAFQIGFVGSVLFGLLALELADRDRPRPVPVVVCLLCSLMCSGVGVAMTVAVGVVVFRRLGAAGAIRVLSLPVGAFVVWFLLAGRSGLRATGDTFNLAVFTGSPIFVARNLANGLGHGWGAPSLGWVVLVLLSAYLVTNLRALWTMNPAVVGLAVASVCFYFMAALGRDRISLTDSPSRYAYIGFALLVPLMAMALGRAPVALQGLRELRWARRVAKGTPARTPFPDIAPQQSGRVWRRRPAAQWAVALPVAMVLAATGTNIVAAQKFTSARTVFVRALGDQIITTAWLSLSPRQLSRAINPYPIWSSGAASGYLTPAMLHSLALRHLLPAPSPAEMSPESLRWAESWLDIAGAPAPLYRGRFSVQGLRGLVQRRPHKVGTFPPMATGCRTFVAGGGMHRHNVSASYLAHNAALQLVLGDRSSGPASVEVSLGARGGRLRAMLAEPWGTGRPVAQARSNDRRPSVPPPPAGSWLGQILVFHPGQRVWLDMSVPGAAMTLSLEKGQAVRLCGLYR